MAVVTSQNPRVNGIRPRGDDPFVDGDAYAGGADFVLSTIARGFQPATTGNLIVDFMGGIDGRTAGTNITVAVVAGTTFRANITKIYNTSVAGVVLY